MDPITQGAVGAAVAVATTRQHRLPAAITGALAGMAPDLDVFIRSDIDPLLTLEYHRQFTHSLIFIPVIGGLCALLVYALWGRRHNISLSMLLLWGLLGCATHGLLDGCTSYGTQLLWPFTDHRFAWDIISVVDPIFTLPLLALLVIAIKSSRNYWRACAIGWMVVYLGIGSIQHYRAIEMGYQLVAERGHQPLRLQAKPSFANLAVWKVVYETDSAIYTAAVKPGIGQPVTWPGESIHKPSLAQSFPWLQDNSQQNRDIKRFSRFSDGYIAIDPHNPMRIFDARYSMLPHRIEPMWGIELSSTKAVSEHANYFTQRQNSSAALRMLMTMMFE